MFKLNSVRLISPIFLSCCLFFLANCGGGEESSDRRAENASSDAATPSTPSSSAARQESLPKIVAFGDSLTAGYGLASAESYPALLQAMLERDGYRYEVVNAGVSGDTSAGGVQRIDWALEGDVRVVILELGANDMLRGLPVKAMKANLERIIRRAKERGARVLLAGMYAAPYLGPEYQREYRAAFEDLARDEQIPLIPFFLERVAGIDTLNLPDRAHPNVEGTKIVAATVYQSLRPLLDQQQAQK